MSATSPHKHDGGLFHSIKGKLFHGEKQADNEYDGALNTFNTLNESMNKIKAASNNYLNSITSTFLNSNNCSAAFSALLEEAGHPNQYQDMCEKFRVAHNLLNPEKQQALSVELHDTVLKSIDETLTGFKVIQQRIASRNELHKELEYYANKVHELDKERNERASKGKSESSKDTEKYQRNQEKLKACTTDYTTFAGPLITDLNHAWATRIDTLGPVLVNFVRFEKHFLEIYNSAINEVNSGEKLVPNDSVKNPLSMSTDIPTPIVAGTPSSYATATASSVTQPAATNVISDHPSNETVTLSMPSVSMKREGEEESKRQRFEEDQKVAQNV